jgi:hypothetical protein
VLFAIAIGACFNISLSTLYDISIIDSPRQFAKVGLR